MNNTLAKKEREHVGRVKKMDEVDALSVTVKRLVGH